jgi:hypothetical protein
MCWEKTVFLIVEDIVTSVCGALLIIVVLGYKKETRFSWSIFMIFVTLNFCVFSL